MISTPLSAICCSISRSASNGLKQTTTPPALSTAK